MHAPDAVREPVAKRHRPSGLTVFLSAFVAGAVVSFGLNHFVDAQLAQNRPQVECEPIFVALRSLPQGAPVTVWDVALKDWPLAMLPTSALRAEDSFEGTVLRYPLREGQPLLAVQLVKAPTDHSAIAADVEMFKQPTPAATRQAPVVEADSWLPVPKTTSTDIPPAADMAATPIGSPRYGTSEMPPETPVEEVAEAGLAAVSPVPDVPAAMPVAMPVEEMPFMVADGAGADVAAVVQDDAAALPLVAIADTPVETTLAEHGLPESADQAPLAAVEVDAEATLVMATPPAEILPHVEEPLEGVVATDIVATEATTTDRAATDEPRPFVAARRTPAPVAPQPQLDIADSIAALTRARSPAPASGPLEPSPDAPAASVLVAQPEPREADSSAAPNDGDVPGDAVADADTKAAARMADESAGNRPADTATAQTDSAIPTSEGASVPLPIPRYLVIPERIALEADSFFGPTGTELESPNDPTAQQAVSDQTGSGPRPRAQYEAPPVTNPPPPTLGEMFPNIANGIDALSAPFRGRSAQQPQRTR
jgi:hypothetical protein